MNWLYKKNLSIFFFVIIFIGSFFATNTQGLITQSEKCDLEDIHVNPCAVVSVEGSLVHLEQDMYVSHTTEHLALVDTAYLSLVKKVITIESNTDSYYYPHDISPPSRIQLARSHI